MSLVSFIGPKPNLLGHQRGQPAAAARSQRSRCSTSTTWRSSAHIERYTGGKFKSLRARHHLSARLGQGRRSRRSLASLCAAGRGRGARAATTSSIISDRNVDREQVAIPALLALSAIHQHLVAQGPAHLHRPGRRDRLGARGASLRAARRLRRRGGASRTSRWKRWPRCTRTCPASCRADKAIYNYVKAIGKGLTKVMSKMGISTYMSYCGAQMFEAVGLEQVAGRQVLHAAPPANVEGIGLFEVAEEAIRMHQRRVRRRPGARRHARRRRRIRLARARRRAHVDAGRDRQAAALRRAPTTSRPTRNTRSSSTTSRSAT